MQSDNATEPYTERRSPLAADQHRVLSEGRRQRAAGGQRGARRARSYCRFVPPFICFIPDSLKYLVTLFLKRQCDRTLGARQPLRDRRGLRRLQLRGQRPVPIRLVPPALGVDVEVIQTPRGMFCTENH